MAQLTLSDYQNNLFSNHFLEERIQEMDEWQETDIDDEYNWLINQYEEAKRYLSNNPNEPRTWKKFIRHVAADLLNHHPEPEPESESGLNPDYTLFNGPKEFLDAKDDEAEFERAYGLLEIKRWRTKFDKSTDDNSNPAYQTYNYVDRLRVPWGILTDGKKWRLYSYEKCGKKTFFEIDLLENVIHEPDEEKAKRNFKLFYLLFRQKAFTPKEKGFADRVLEGSIKYSEKLKDSLKEDVYSAVETACQGFFEFTDQDPDEENRKLVHDSALILMYRLLFIMNAESRGLLPIQNETYQEEYSVQWFQEQIAEKEEIPEFRYNTLGWDRLTKLFRGINSGESLDRNNEIPPYNGGLFEHPKDDDNVDPENEFLAGNALPGPFLKKIIKLLGTTEKGDDLRTVDYRDLDIRHLGSIYEGLLENKLKPPAEENMVLKDGEWKEASQEEFDKAPESRRVEEGNVYLANESGERKATGSYYTPDYIVEYIVENTIGPKVEEKVEKFSEDQTEEQKLADILDLNICDPAMGSGHFLTEATNFIADAIIENIEMEKLDIEEEDETNWAKRQVVQNCIYGVDINPLATELAKVSLWIETMAEGKPLNFLDHHLKVGNSLIGADFEDIFLHPFSEEQKSLEQIDEDKFRFSSPQRMAEKFREEYAKIEEENDENSIEDIKKKEEMYEEFRNELIYKQFKQLANIHTRQYFEEEIDQAEYESELIQSIGAENTHIGSTEWFENAQKDAEERKYFHWQLEFPKVFFGEQNGFDAVVGNPPYLLMEDIPESTRRFAYGSNDKPRYISANSKTNIYALFIEKGYFALAQQGKLGYINPYSWMGNSSFKPFRQFLLKNADLEEITLLPNNIFEDPDTESSILILNNRDSSERLKGRDLSDRDVPKKPELLQKEDFSEFDQRGFLDFPESIITFRLDETDQKIVANIRENTEELQKSCKVDLGVKTADDDKFIGTEKIESRNPKRLLRGKDFERYSYCWRGDYLYYEPEKMKENKSTARPGTEERFEEPKLIMHRFSSENYKVALDKQGHYTLSSTYTIRTENDLPNLETYAAELNSSVIKYYLDKFISGNRLSKTPVRELPIATRENSRLEKKVNNLKESRSKEKNLRNQFLDWLERRFETDENIREILFEKNPNNFSELLNILEEEGFESLLQNFKNQGEIKRNWKEYKEDIDEEKSKRSKLKAEIDSIVFDLYELNEEEVKTILDSLDTPEDEKKDILEKFNEVRD